MIASFHGKSWSLVELSKRAELREDGLSLLGLTELAESIGFQTASLRLSFGSLIEMAPFPCVVHFKRNHFVVLYEVVEDRFVIADPGYGLIQFTQHQFLNRWLSNEADGKSGVVLLLEPKGS